MAVSDWLGTKQVTVSDFQQQVLFQVGVGGNSMIQEGGLKAEGEGMKAEVGGVRGGIMERLWGREGLVKIEWTLPEERRGMGGREWVPKVGKCLRRRGE